jgi:hypothetical protein
VVARKETHTGFIAYGYERSVAGGHVGVVVVRNRAPSWLSAVSLEVLYRCRTDVAQMSQSFSSTKEVKSSFQVILIMRFAACIRREYISFLKSSPVRSQSQVESARPESAVVVAATVVVLRKFPQGWTVQRTIL